MVTHADDLRCLGCKYNTPEAPPSSMAMDRVNKILEAVHTGLTIPESQASVIETLKDLSGYKTRHRLNSEEEKAIVWGISSMFKGRDSTKNDRDFLDNAMLTMRLSIPSMTRVQVNLIKTMKKSTGRHDREDGAPSKQLKPAPVIFFDEDEEEVEEKVRKKVKTEDEETKRVKFALAVIAKNIVSEPFALRILYKKQPHSQDVSPGDWADLLKKHRTLFQPRVQNGKSVFGLTPSGQAAAFGLA